MKLFELGNIVATPAAIKKMEVTGTDEIYLLGNHQKGNWTEMEPDDQNSNKQAIIDGTRIFSAYTVKGIKFWVITEADRSVTTILLPTDY